MKRLLLCLVLVLAGSVQLFCSSQLSPAQVEELSQIVSELNEIVDEQQTIIENSQNRNEELEKLSESKQKTIEEQAKTIEELQSLSKEQKRFSLRETIRDAVLFVLAFLSGCAVGVLFL